MWAIHIGGRERREGVILMARSAGSGQDAGGLALCWLGYRRVLPSGCTI